MIEVRSPLEIRADQHGGWQLTFWVLDAFNDATPFRAMLADIAIALGQDAKTVLRLPSYQTGENFVEGSLKFGGVRLRTYYEHSLSYLALMNDNESALRDAAARIQPYVAIIP